MPHATCRIVDCLPLGHAACNTLIFQQALEVFTSVLTALIGVMHQGINDQLGSHARTHGPANRASRIQVQHHGHIQPTLDRPNVGEVRRGVSAHECQIAARQAMHWAGITHLADTVPTKLSGGEKQRVALARTRMLNPKIILLDEPTASLDSAGRIQVINLIEELCNENICMLIACHDRELIDLPKMHTVHLSSADARVGTA